MEQPLIFFGGILIFVALFIAGSPIWLSLAVSGVFLSLFYSGMVTMNIASTLFSSVNSFVLLAVPFFLLGGNIMARCGPAKHLFNGMDAVVGGLPGGLPLATVFTSMIFAAITGSTLATLVAVGSIAVPPMVEKGYPKRFTLGLMCVCGTLGQIIPPSIYMILYGAYVQENVAKLFMGGLIPGIILGLIIAAVAAIISWRRGFGIATRTKLSGREKLRRVLWAVPAGIMPLIILGGIYSGVFTPTEAASVACVYAFLVSWLVYRGLSRQNFLEAAKATATTTSMIFLIVAAVIIFAGPLTYAQIPQNITKGLVGMGFGTYGFLFVAIGLYLLLGLFLDPLPILYLTVPVLLHGMLALGIDLTHFCVITIICMQIAQVTPPFGVSLYCTSQVFKEPMQNVIRSAIPYLLVLILTLPIFVYFPQLSLWLPKMLGM